jgi:hypothetical protein
MKFRFARECFDWWPQWADTLSFTVFFSFGQNPGALFAPVSQKNLF